MCYSPRGSEVRSPFPQWTMISVFHWNLIYWHEARAMDGFARIVESRSVEESRRGAPSPRVSRFSIVPSSLRKDSISYWSILSMSCAPRNRATVPIRETIYAFDRLTSFPALCQLTLFVLIVDSQIPYTWPQKLIERSFFFSLSSNFSSLDRKKEKNKISKIRKIR